MAEITAKMVKELREATGAGMMECKKALTEAEGDFEKAVDVLRTHGLAKAAKKAGRATNEGRVNVAVCKNDARKGAVVEVNCETDFVALTDKFQDYCDTFTRAVVHNNPATVDELLESEYEGEKVGDALTEAIHIIGENMQISNFKRLEIDGTGALVPCRSTRKACLRASASTSSRSTRPRLPSPASPRTSRRRSPRAVWRSSTRRTASWSRSS